MNTALAVAALLLARDAAAEETRSPGASACQSYTRKAPAAPELVRGWLQHSSDDHVLVCRAQQEGAASAAEPVYSGESVVSKAGGVCRYETHLLALAGAGKMIHLQRYDATEAVAMAAVGDASCPPAHDPAIPKRYTMTYDLTPATFESLMAFWGATAGSAAEFDRALSCCGAGGAAASAGGSAANAQRLRVRAAIVDGHMRAAAVTRIVRMATHGLLHRRYALFVDDPESRMGAKIYVIYLTRLLRGPWHISGISDAAP